MTSEIPLTLQTAYAELLDRAASAAFDEAFAEIGDFTPKTIRGRRYWYFQSQTDEGRRQHYVGPETPELLERIAKHRQSRDDQRERRALVSTLVRSAGLPPSLPQIGDVVAALARAGVFRLRGVLIGTVAYQTYGGLLGTRLPAAAIQTGDVDVAQFANVSIALEDKTPTMLEVLRQVDPSFRPVPNAHDHRRTTSYQARRGLRVEFLTPNIGPDTEAPKTLRALGTDAQPLRFLDFLIHEPVPAVLLHETGIYVTVPAPERYALHKLIVAQRRRDTSTKRNKDIEQAQSLLNVLAEQRPVELRAAWEEAYKRGKKWQRHLGEGLGRIDSNVRDRFLKLVGAPRSIIPGLSLQFAAPVARYDFDRDIVTFIGEAGGSPVRCAISREALDDHFDADGLDKEGRLRQYREHREQIEQIAQLKYLERSIEEIGAVLIKTADVPDLRNIRSKAKSRPRDPRSPRP
jgi:hypothetical protein